MALEMKRIVSSVLMKSAALIPTKVEIAFAIFVG
jgi:hypothetical protein